LFGRLAVLGLRIFLEICRVKYLQLINVNILTMQKRKLQVFVSSTFIDLKEERQTAVQAILNAGHIPAGMELFTAGDESQWTIIKRWIEESDVYMLLLGGRYGSIEPKSGKSYTHLEYDYAVELGKPLFAIVINDKALDEKVTKEGKMVLELDNPQGLKDFKKVVTSNMCAFWDDLKDIKLNVNDSIRDIEYRYANSLKGWVKADDTDYSSISEELARLSKENSELKSQLDGLNKEYTINGINISDFTTHLKNDDIRHLQPFQYYLEGNSYIPQDSLELFMSLGYGHSYTGNLRYVEEIKPLINYNLVNTEGLMTEKGSLLFTYVIQNGILWQSEIFIKSDTPAHPKFQFGAGNGT
jgi:Domain of unknown function (DUF4062)